MYISGLDKDIGIAKASRCLYKQDNLNTVRYTALNNFIHILCPHKYVKQMQIEVSPRKNSSAAGSMKGGFVRICPTFFSSLMEREKCKLHRHWNYCSATLFLTPSFMLEEPCLSRATYTLMVYSVKHLVIDTKSKKLTYIPDKSKFPHSCRVIQTMDVNQAALDHGTEVLTQFVSASNQGLELRTGHTIHSHM